MLNNRVIDTVDNLSSYDKVLLINYLFNSLNKDEDPEIRTAWTEESVSRLTAVRERRLDTVGYDELKNSIK